MEKEFKIKIKKGQSFEKLCNNKKICELLTEDNVFLEDLEILIKSPMGKD